MESMSINKVQFDRYANRCHRKRNRYKPETVIGQLLLEGIEEWSFEPWKGKGVEDDDASSIRREFCVAPIVLRFEAVPLRQVQNQAKQVGDPCAWFIIHGELGPST